VLGVALASCSTSADPTESIDKACAAFQDATEADVEAQLDIMINESAAAASADSQYQPLADAFVILGDLALSVDEEQEDSDADFENIVAALESIEETCGSLE
jgi:hypothetical protein